MEKANENEQLTKGGCVCGAVQFEASGSPQKVMYCHCGFCRQQTGAPAVVFVVYNRDQVEFTKGVHSLFESGPGAMRGFCDQCGTPLSWEGDAAGNQVVEFHVGVMENIENFTPTLHASVKERLPWFDFQDALPRHQGSSNEPAE